MRTIDDSDRLKEVLATGSHLAVIGGGWIGLEVAAAACQAGLQVTVVEAILKRGGNRWCPRAGTRRGSRVVNQMASSPVLTCASMGRHVDGDPLKGA